MDLSDYFFKLGVVFALLFLVLSMTFIGFKVWEHQEIVNELDPNFTEDVIVYDRDIWIQYIKTGDVQVPVYHYKAYVNSSIDPDMYFSQNIRENTWLRLFWFINETHEYFLYKKFI